MMIDQVFPHVVGDHGVLKDRLFQRAREQGLSVEQATERFAGIPAPLTDAETFLDKLTGLWRYEFGVPINVRRGVGDYLKPRHDSLRTITIERDDYGWPLPSEPGDFEELLFGLPEHEHAC